MTKVFLPFVHCELNGCRPGIGRSFLVHGIINYTHSDSGLKCYGFYDNRLHCKDNSVFVLFSTDDKNVFLIKKIFLMNSNDSLKNKYQE